MKSTWCILKGVAGSLTLLVLAATLGRAALAQETDVALTWTHPDPSTVDSYTLIGMRDSGTVDLVPGVAPTGPRQTEVIPSFLPATFTVEAVNEFGSAMSNAIRLTGSDSPSTWGFINLSNAVTGPRGRIIQYPGQLSRNGVLEVVPATSRVICKGGGISCPLVARFTLSMPEPNSVYAWGRMLFRGSGNDANSFWLCINANCERLGNNLNEWGQWHWDGNGISESGQLPAFMGNFPAGDHLVEVRVRESYPTGPLLDILFFSSSSSVVPSDGQVSTTSTTATTLLMPPTTTTTTTKPPPTTTTTTTTTKPPPTTTTTTTTVTLPPPVTTTSTTTTTTLPTCHEADLNKDGHLDDHDVLLMLRIVMGLEDCW